MADTNRQWRLANRPEGTPDRDVFKLVETDVPDPGPGEVLVRTLYLSVYPALRVQMDRTSDSSGFHDGLELGDPLQGGVVGEVVESNGAGFERGDIVTGDLEWTDYSTALGTDLRPVDPDLAPISTALGVLGVPGWTAYFGTREVTNVRAEDTFVVTGAAGAVGSVAGQIAKLSGARVVGFAGSDEKVRFVEDELGFDRCINYQQTDDYRGALDDAAPEGVDCYFDNVGGPITDAVFTRLNLDARVAVCGQISMYNATEVPTGPRKLHQLISPRATVEGFIVFDFAPRFEEATERLAAWINSGDVRYRETVAEGLENAPEAFLGLFEGENIGKQLVKVSERELDATE